MTDFSGSETITRRTIVPELICHTGTLRQEHPVSWAAWVARGNAKAKSNKADLQTTRYRVQIWRFSYLSYSRLCVRQAPVHSLSPPSQCPQPGRQEVNFSPRTTPVLNSVLAFDATEVLLLRYSRSAPK